MAGARFTRAVRTALAWSEEGLDITVGLLLLAAAVLVIVGTVSGLITSIRTHQSAVDVGVVLLDRILLALIVAELLHTLRFVVLRGEIVVEPFLFVGLIAVVRRILIITAELEGQPPGGRALTNQLLELAFARSPHSRARHRDLPSATRRPERLRPRATRRDPAPYQLISVIAGQPRAAS